MTYDKEYARDVLGADCDSCPLRVGGKFVPSEGPETASVAFVGEAPGVREAREGRPFIGPSGRLLTIVNEQYGIKREEVFLTNACLCRPADGTNPPKQAIAACRPRLLRELEQRSVGTVVALGNSAALATLGVEGVTRLRVGPGRESPYKSLAGVRIIPTIHPAACLRQSDMFPSLVADVGKVVTEHVTWNPPQIFVHDDPVDAIEVLTGVQRRASDLVVDIEVDIEKDSAFGHPNQYGLLSVGLAWESGTAHVIGEGACADDGVRDAMAEAFNASRLIAHNGKFDLAGLYPVLGPTELYFDTMLASYALDERPGVHGLKYLAVEFLGAPKYDEEIKRYVGPRDGYGVIPRDKLYVYNGYDVACTYQLFELFSSRLARQDLRRVHDFLVEASNELMYLELNGLPVDRQYADTLADKYLASIDLIGEEIDSALLDAGYQRINPRSPLQVKQALAHWRIDVDSTNEDTLKLVRTRAKPGSNLDLFLDAMLRHRREAKIYGTYVKGIIKRMYRGRVYSTFLLHGSTTGRLASRNPNLQNIVRDAAIKQMYIPGKPENVFVQADYKQAELRTLSWASGCEYLRDILNDPSRDLFDELTPQLRPDLPGIGSTFLSADEWKDIRVRVKAFVYGLNYGRHFSSIAKEYDMDIDEASMMTKNFFALIPEVVDWQKRVREDVYNGKDLITPFGRHRRFHLITEENWKAIQNEALAFLPQSTSSDVCLRAMVRVRRDLRGSGAFVRNIVHDSILVDCPPDMSGDVATLLDKRMVESGQELVGDYIQYATDVKIGKHWGEV